MNLHKVRSPVVSSEPSSAAAVAELDPSIIGPDVYAPQDDSWLLCQAVADAGVAVDARVLDMCTGSGAVGLEAARLGARSVTAYDISPAAVECAARQARSENLDVDVRLGSFDDAAELSAFDVVLCNPPYVPAEAVPVEIGLERAWNAGPDGRIVLDRLCESAADLVQKGGVLMLVQSEFADPDKSLQMLSDNGFRVREVVRSTIAFGPVMDAQARWLERTGRLEIGRRTEELVVIRADR
ncbi:HemK2/MTQ2 family protein methyltransferase [Rhodococcoides trifolii]|uniref:HemK2/MTQ2 family protein methyltransferase n=1 Tax=Rhodococcoides trifolii TaxID=908250 RepID=UPI00353011A5